MDTTLSRSPWFLPIALAALLLAPIPALAHAELVSTSPEAGAELEAPPDEVVLVFDDELDPEASSFTVTDDDGGEVGRGEVDLQVAERNELRGTVTIDAPGEYTVTWSIAAADDHPDEGTYAFTVAGGEEEGDSTPDTAVAEPRGVRAPVLAGLALLFIAARMARRRLTVERSRVR